MRSFKFAGNGVWLTLRTQHNAWIHALASLIVVGAGYFLGISRNDWCIIIFACAGVWIAESLNTAIEFVADATSKEFNPLIGKAKDVAAGAVLIAAIAAVIVGLLVFVPYLTALVASPLKHT